MKMFSSHSTSTSTSTFSPLKASDRRVEVEVQVEVEVLAVSRLAPNAIYFHNSDGGFSGISTVCNVGFFMNLVDFGRCG